MSVLSLPPLFADHMMLQQGKRLPVTGSAAPGETVTAVLTRQDGTVSGSASAACDQSGAFRLELPPQQPGTGYTLTVSVAGGENAPQKTISDIAAGDIWMACGQSNMEYFLRYDADWNRTKQQPRNPMIRMYNVPQIAFEGQQKETEGAGFWFEEGDDAWRLFSAPGYSFARTLQPEADIPVGIIGCNWGGTPACAWMDKSYCSSPKLQVFAREYEEALQLYTPQELERRSMEALAFENSYHHGMEWQAVMYGLTLSEQETWIREHASDPVLPMGPWHHYRPFGLYHTMILKTAPFAVKGILWYQGESDSGHAQIYDQTMAALIRCFRDTFEDPALPFLFVQLAPFGRWLECTGDGYDEVRCAQQRAADTIPGAYMASIMDLGSYEDIHPKFKMEVGRRLALLALRHVYGRDVLCDGPIASSGWFQPDEDGQGGLLTLFMEHAGKGLRGSVGDELEITCAGSPLPVQSVTVCGGRLLVRTGPVPAGSTILVVSFARRDYCTVSLYNSAGLSARPFTLKVPLTGS